MADLNFEATPFGSLAMISREKRSRYFPQLGALPKSIKDIVHDMNTAGFLRGLTKQFKVAVEQVPQIAFVVLRVAVGEIELAKLGATLSSELKLPNDKAQGMAKEIEKELFAPVMKELGEFLETRKQKSENRSSQAKQAGATNVVDLKNTAGKAQKPRNAQ